MAYVIQARYEDVQLYYKGTPAVFIYMHTDDKLKALDYANNNITHTAVSTIHGKAWKLMKQTRTVDNFVAMLGGTVHHVRFEKKQKVVKKRAKRIVLL